MKMFLIKNDYILHSKNGKSFRRILLDTGDADKPNYIENLRQVLHSENATIGTILLTHWHHDHIGGVKDILPILDNSPKIWKFPRTDEADVYDEIPASVQLHPLVDGQVFSVDGATVEVVYTPGHTTDHVVLHMKESNALFSGDCILGEGTAVFEDLYDYMRSLQIILDRAPAIIYPAHGNTIVDDPLGKIQYYIDHRNRREAQIFDVLRENSDSPFTAMQLVERIYVDTPSELWPAAAYNVSHHLQKMTKEGRIVHHSDDSCNDTWQCAASSAAKL